MRAEPLDTVLGLRRRAVDEARRRLAASTETATQAARQTRERERRIETETERACDNNSSDQLVEAFAAWLPGARHDVVQARTAQDRSDAEVARCRAELAACRTALEAIQTLIAERDAARAELRTRAMQRELDDFGQRRPAILDPN